MHVSFNDLAFKLRNSSSHFQGLVSWVCSRTILVISPNQNSSSILIPECQGPLKMHVLKGKATQKRKFAH
jgi:hypothetical protein